MYEKDNNNNDAKWQYNKSIMEFIILMIIVIIVRIAEKLAKTKRYD